MGIFSRFSDIMNANINSLLDRAEDPEKMLRLMIAEMEETLVEVRTTSARLIADRKTLERRQAQLHELAAEWERKAEVAIRREREDLARAALLEKQRVSEDAEAIDEELADFSDQLQKLGEDTANLQAKLTEARQRQKSLAARMHSGNSRLQARKRVHEYDSSAALARFEQYERRLDRLEGEVESYGPGRKPDSPTLAEEIDALEADDRIEAEFEALKARIKGHATAEPNE